VVTGRVVIQAMWLQGVGEGRFMLGEGLGSTSVNHVWALERRSATNGIHNNTSLVVRLHTPPSERGLLPTLRIGLKVLPFSTNVNSSIWHVFISSPTSRHPCHLSKLLFPRWQTINEPWGDVDWQVLSAKMALPHARTHEQMERRPHRLRNTSASRNGVTTWFLPLRRC
jgi:hypothetical protein